MVYVPTWPSGHSSPSYDLYLFERRLGEQWIDGLGRVVTATPSMPSPSMLTAFERFEATVGLGLRGVTTSPTPAGVLIDHAARGISILLGADLVTIQAPYDTVDDEAEELVATLQWIVDIAEQTTGRIAYDPQADTPFLGDADRTAAERISQETRRIG